MKTTMSYHLTPVRMTIINKSTNNKCWWGCGERGTLLHCWGECRLVQPLWKAVWRHLKKVKNRAIFWPSTPTSGNVYAGTQNTNWKEHKYPYVHCGVIYNQQDMEVASVSISIWADKTIMEHLHNGMLLSHKKEEYFIFVTPWLDLENIMLSEISQSKKNKYHMISLIRGT